MADQDYSQWQLQQVPAGDFSGWTLEQHPVEAEATPDASESLRRGLWQGASLGYGDEITGGLGGGVLAWLQKHLEADRIRLTPEARAEAEKLGIPLPQGTVQKSLGDNYRELRDAERSRNAAAEKENPGIYRTAEVGGGVLASMLPGMGIARGTPFKQVATRLATQGAIAGLGASGTDLTSGELPQYLRAGVDTALGGATGLGAAYGGRLLGGLGNRIADRFSGVVRNAEADQALATTRAADKALNSARGALGGDSAAVMDAVRAAEHAVSSPMASAEQKAQAQAFLDNPQVKQLFQDALSNKLELGAEKASGRLLNSRAAYEAAQAARTPEAIEAAAAEKMAHPVREQVLPRLKKYATRVIPPLVGAGIGAKLGGTGGSLIGTGVGGALAAVMGDPGTAFSNMAKSPAFRAWAAGEARDVAQGFANRAGPALADQATQAPSALSAALRRYTQPDYSSWTPVEEAP